MALYDDKNNQNNRKSMGDDLLEGIGSALPFAKTASEKITGHSVEGDIKMIKGFSDSEYDEMDAKQVTKLKNTYFFRMLVLPFGAYLLISGVSKYPRAGFFEALLGVLFLVIGITAVKQYRKAKKYLDENK